ncbi:hypothetical protein BH20ACT2_BH20ACT2_12270 [soil metagenome]
MTSFDVTWDYRCPFARNAHEHLLDGLAGGAGWEVGFVPFSLSQAHVVDGEPDVWENPESDSGLLALQVGLLVRDRYADRFAEVHRALFAARHDEGRHLTDETVLRDVLDHHDVDADTVFEEIADGSPVDAVRKEHEAAVADHEVWGVPTFIADGQAAFVRLMDRPAGDADVARRTIDEVIGLLEGSPALNEFKHTSLAR